MFVFRCCRLPYLVIGLSSCLHPYKAFICLAYIDKQLSRKATLMSQDVLLVEPFHPTYLNLFYFKLNQLRDFPGKTYRGSEKSVLLSAPGGQYTFFRTTQQPISVRHDLKSKLRHILFTLRCKTLYYVVRCYATL